MTLSTNNTNPYNHFSSTHPTASTDPKRPLLTTIIAINFLLQSSKSKKEYWHKRTTIDCTQEKKVSTLVFSTLEGNSLTRAKAENSQKRSLARIDSRLRESRVSAALEENNEEVVGEKKVVAPQPIKTRKTRQQEKSAHIRRHHQRDVKYANCHTILNDK